MEIKTGEYPTPQVKIFPDKTIKPDFTKSSEPPQIPAAEYSTSEKPLPPKQKQSFEDLWQQATETPRK